MVRNWVVEEVVDFGRGHCGSEGGDRSSSLLSQVNGVGVWCGECACRSLESWPRNYDALVGLKWKLPASLLPYFYCQRTLRFRYDSLLIVATLCLDLRGHLPLYLLQQTLPAWTQLKLNVVPRCRA